MLELAPTPEQGRRRTRGGHTAGAGRRWPAAKPPGPGGDHPGPGGGHPGPGEALRALGNRLVGILHGCLAHRVAYQEQIAWPTAETVA
jgi:hypothetical protein